MNNLATTVVASQLKKAVQGNEAGFDKIDWNNYNYPPFINIFHYDIGHIKEEDRKLVSRINFFFIGQILFFPLNFLNAIIQTAVGYSWTRLLSSIFWCAIIIGLSGYGFYHCFRAFCGDNSNPMLKYKITSAILLLLFIFQFIVDKICWNSIIRWIRLFRDGHGFAGVISLIEWLIFSCNFTALIYLILQVMKTGYWKK